jgi:hypothetical protein
MEKPEPRAKLEAFQSLFSFDLRTQLHGLTLYGTGSKPEQGVLLVYADFDPARLVSLAQSAKDAEETPYKKNTIYSWTDEKKKAHDGIKPRTYAAIQGKCVIFGQQEDSVGRALDVLTGATSNLGSTKTFPQMGGAGSSTFLQAAARKMDFAAADPNAAILRLAKFLRVEVGEAHEQVSAALTLEANDDEVASNMTSIARGLVALMKLQKEKPESVRIADALTLKQEGPSLAVRLTLPSSDVVEMIKADAERKAHRKTAKETE